MQQIKIPMRPSLWNSRRAALFLNPKSSCWRCVGPFNLPTPWAALREALQEGGRRAIVKMKSSCKNSQSSAKTGPFKCLKINFTKIHTNYIDDYHAGPNILLYNESKGIPLAHHRQKTPSYRRLLEGVLTVFGLGCSYKGFVPERLKAL